jgi:hypothetical protein
MTTRKVKSEHTLSNGQTLQVMSGTGRDMINAERLAPKGSTMGLAMALTASKIQIDKKPITYDEFLDMDEEVVQEIIMLVNPDKEASQNFTSQPKT